MHVIIRALWKSSSITRLGKEIVKTTLKKVFT